MLMDPEARAEADAVVDEFEREVARFLTHQATPSVLNEVRRLALEAGCRIARIAPSVDPPTGLRIIGRGGAIYLRFLGVSPGLRERLREVGFAPPPERTDDCPQCGGSGGGEGARRCHVCRGTGRIPNSNEDYYDAR